MKKGILLLVSAILFGASIFADEAKLVDLSAMAGVSLDLSEEAKALGYTTDEQISVVSDLKLSGEWELEFNASSNTLDAKVSSAARYISGASTAYGDMILVKAFLPNHPSTVMVKPLFPLDINEANKGLGYITNIATVKSIKADFSGINRLDDIYIVYRDGYGNKTELKMTKPNQRIRGAVTCTWDNPLYINDPRKRDLEYSQTYPRMNTEMIFEGFKIRTVSGGDIYFGFGNVTVIYDKAYIEEEKDIDFENVFGIEGNAAKKERLEATKKILEREFGVFEEKLKMHKDTDEETTSTEVPSISEK